MNYFIQVDANGNITAQYDGMELLPKPWVAITAAQYAAILPGSTWSGSAVSAPAEPTVSSKQQLVLDAQALIAGGLSVTSTASPNLNGTYATDAQAQANMLGIVSYINANGKFPGSAATLTWYDVEGKAHSFSAVEEFMALYSAGLDFVMDCQLVADAGAGDLPAAIAAIP